VMTLVLQTPVSGLCVDSRTSKFQDIDNFTSPGKEHSDCEKKIHSMKIVPNWTQTDATHDSCDGPLCVRILVALGVAFC
jgi:hypothetical protein